MDTAILESWSAKERINNEAQHTKVMDLPAQWSEEYRTGYIDGLKRAVELFDPKN